MATTLGVTVMGVGVAVAAPSYNTFVTIGYDPNAPGYSFVGGTANYGQARLGEHFVPAALLLGPVALATAARRRSRT